MTSGDNVQFSSYSRIWIRLLVAVVGSWNRGAKKWGTKNGVKLFLVLGLR